MLLLTVVVAFACAYGQDVHYNYDRDANFAAYKTYQWVDLPGRVPDQLVDGAVKRSVDEQLARKGLTKVEKAVLTDHVGTYDPATLERLSMLTRGMISRGVDAVTAKQQALMVIDRQISAQASVLAFSRLYLVSGLLLVAALPLLLIWRTGRAAGVKGEIPH